MTGSILALNAGSSSLKFALFGPGDPSPRLLSGNIERIGEPGGPADHAACVEPLLEQVEIVYLPPVVAFPTGAGVFRRAPHPHASLLFVDFMLTDGQKILAGREAVPTNAKVRPPPDGLIFVDLPRFLDEGEKWTRLFRATFAGGPR